MDYPASLARTKSLELGVLVGTRCDHLSPGVRHLLKTHANFIQNMSLPIRLRREYTKPPSQTRTDTATWRGFELALLCYQDLAFA